MEHIWLLQILPLLRTPHASDLQFWHNISPDQAQRAKESSKDLKPKEPESFTGKGSVHIWITHVTNYIGSDQNPQAFSIDISYLEGPAHEWWIGCKEAEEAQQINIWRLLDEALIYRFEFLNSLKSARDKLAKWRQIKDVSSFNEDFQKILLDIPSITIEERTDRYARGLKPFIWRNYANENTIP